MLKLKNSRLVALSTKSKQSESDAAPTEPQDSIDKHCDGESKQELHPPTPKRSSTRLKGRDSGKHLRSTRSSPAKQNDAPEQSRAALSPVMEAKTASDVPAMECDEEEEENFLSFADSLEESDFPAEVRSNISIVDVHFAMVVTHS